MAYCGTGKGNCPEREWRAERFRKFIVETTAWPQQVREHLDYAWVPIAATSWRAGDSINKGKIAKEKGDMASTLCTRSVHSKVVGFRKRFHSRLLDTAPERRFGFPKLDNVKYQQSGHRPQLRCTYQLFIKPCYGIFLTLRLWQLFNDLIECFQSECIAGYQIWERVASYKINFVDRLGVSCDLVAGRCLNRLKGEPCTISLGLRGLSICWSERLRVRAAFVLATLLELCLRLKRQQCTEIVDKARTGPVCAGVEGASSSSLINVASSSYICQQTKIVKI